MPSFERYGRWISAFGLFTAGAIVGAAVFMGIYQENMSYLLEQKGTLEIQNKTLTDDLSSLQKQKTKQQYISKVDVLVEVPEHKAADTDVNVLNEIKRRVYDDLRPINGKSISAIRDAPDIFANLVDKKVYRNVFGQNYIVTVRQLFVIQTTFTVHVSYSIHKQD